MEAYYLAAMASVLGVQLAPLAVRLAACFGSAKDAFLAGPEEANRSVELNEHAAAVYARRYRKDLPEQIYDYCRKHKTLLLTCQDSAYPAGLKEITRPPVVLYLKGRIPSFQYAVAIVGSRKATSYGLSAARRFSRFLSEKGMLVVSGGAYGIDAAAHEGALDAMGTTVAVLGSGFDHLYPARHRELFHRITEKGALITEFPPWVPPAAFHFPLRNRIIVGLSRGVLVVEAARKSGAMITAHTAADENRDVFAMPGPIDSVTSQGTHQLIKEGARLADGPEEILEAYMPCCSHKPVSLREPSLFDTVPAGEKEKVRQLYQYLLTSGGRSLEEIVEHFTCSMAAASMLLLRMEIAGMARKGAGNRYYVL